MASRPGWPAIGTARRCCRRSAASSGSRTSAARAWSGSSSARDPGRSPGCASGSPPPRAWRTASSIPLVGVSTAEALIAASGLERVVLLLPAGPSERLAIRAGLPPTRLAAGDEPDLADGESLVAVDLDGRAPTEALERGETACAGLGPALLRIGAARLSEIGDAAELDTLVPEYVTLPRGVAASAGTVEWSRDPR